MNASVRAKRAGKIHFTVLYVPKYCHSENMINFLTPSHREDNFLAPPPFKDLKLFWSPPHFTQPPPQSINEHSLSVNFCDKTPSS